VNVAVVRRVWESRFKKNGLLSTNRNHSYLFVDMFTLLTDIGRN